MKRRDKEVPLFPLEYEADELELLDELGDIDRMLPEICETELGERWLSRRRDPSGHQASSVVSVILPSPGVWVVSHGPGGSPFREGFS